MIRDDQRVGNGIDTLHLDGHRFRSRTATSAGRQARARRRSTRCTTASRSATPRSSRAAPAARASAPATTCTSTASAGASARARGASCACCHAGRRPAAAAGHRRARRAARGTGATAGARPRPRRRQAVPDRRAAAHVRRQRGRRRGGGAARSRVRPDGRRGRVCAGRSRPSRSSCTWPRASASRCTFTNERKAGPEGPAPRASFHVAKLDRTAESSGVNVGFNPEQTVAPGERARTATTPTVRPIGSATIADFGGNDTGSRGLYGAVVVAPAGAKFADPETGSRATSAPRWTSTCPAGAATATSRSCSPTTTRHRRELHAVPDGGRGPALVNYRSAPRADDARCSARGPTATRPRRSCAPTPGDPCGSTRSARRAPSRGTCSASAAWPGGPDERLPRAPSSRRRASRPWETIEHRRGRRRRLAAQHRRHLLRRPAPSVHRGRHVGPDAEVSDTTCPIRPLPGVTARRGADRVVPHDAHHSWHAAHDRDDPRRHPAAPEPCRNRSGRPLPAPQARGSTASYCRRARRRHSYGAGCGSA